MMKTKIVLLISLISTFAFGQNVNAQHKTNPLRDLPIDIRGGFAMYLEDFVMKPGVKSITIASSLNTDEAIDSLNFRSITEYHFDEKGQLILQKAIHPDFWEDELKPYRYYYKNDLLDSVSGQFNAKFFYNKKHQLETIQYYILYADGTYKPENKEVYFYDKHQRLGEIKFFDEDKYSYHQLLEYDKNGMYLGYKLIQEDTTNYSTKILADGSAETINHSIDVNGKTKFFSRNIFSTDINNNVVNIKTYDIDNQITMQQKLVHQLDKNGNSIGTLTYTNGKLNRKEERTIKYYDEKMDDNRFVINTSESIKKREQPDEVLRNFLEALNNLDFKKAYSYCVGNRWGTAEYFASEKSYGGITSVKIKNIGTIDRSYGNTAKIKAITQITDPINGNGEFEQLFTLELQTDEQWKITNVQLIASNRPQDNWNLKLTEQDWISFNEVDTYLEKIYDTIPNEPQTDNPDDIMEITLQPLHFFKADNKEYALAVVENRGPFYGVSIGHCDLFLFVKNEQNKWSLSDQLLEAGGGGMYGNPGNFEEIIRIGKHSGGIVLSGGQTHMGAYFHNDIIEVKNGKMEHLLNIGTHHSYGNWEGHNGYKICQDLSYKFLKDEKEIYDLQLTITNCLENEKEAPKKIVIPFKDGKYSIPEAFIFSN